MSSLNWFPRWRLILGVIGCAVVLSVLEVALARLRYPEPPLAAYWVVAMWHILPSWLIPAALLPAIVALARAAPVDRASWRANLPIHAVAGVAFTLVHLGGTAAIRAWQGEDFREIFVGLYSRYAVADLFSYGAIVAAPRRTATNPSCASARSAWRGRGSRRCAPSCSRTSSSTR
jgi:hypothetical protein